ncbi:hypothetical protein [Leptospira bouyouniensis]|uniref:DUF4340 domain-containing protein n=1 Tax=Leptospira bouyouniensis TaxID=2484911 RepID=A0ABY2L501_9LEPT|nr:hypothetical protein [Leptospira bouyouniensis]TGK49488.1 hypothetical protein EHQ10_08495 [Leptospira bouyouniensis]
MKLIQRTILPITFIIFPFSLFGESKLFMMYGIKLGQKRNLVSEIYGKSFKSHTFEDGYSYDAFKLDEHILVVESENKRPDLVWAIQIQGNKNPKFFGLNEINLGDNAEKVISTFGKPDEIRNAYDEQTKEELKNIQYYSYDTSRNFSFEVQNQKVTSIKLSFKGIASVADTLEITSTFKILQSKNLYQIALLLDQNFILKEKDQKEFKITENPVVVLHTKNEISNRFFNLPNSLANLSPNDILESLDLKNDNQFVFGKYLKFKKGDETIHLFFLKSYEGWTLKEINIESTPNSAESLK